MEMSEVCALEVDIEYSGSAVLEIETRLEVCELELDKGTGGSNPESSNVGDVPSDLLEGLEYFDKELNLAKGMNDLQEPKEDGDLNTGSYASTSKSSYLFIFSVQWFVNFVLDPPPPMNSISFCSWYKTICGPSSNNPSF